MFWINSLCKLCLGKMIFYTWYYPFVTAIVSAHSFTSRRRWWHPMAARSTSALMAKCGCFSMSAVYISKCPHSNNVETTLWNHTCASFGCIMTQFFSLFQSVCLTSLYSSVSHSRIWTMFSVTFLAPPTFSIPITAESLPHHRHISNSGNRHSHNNKALGTLFETVSFVDVTHFRALVA